MKTMRAMICVLLIIVMSLTSVCAFAGSVKIGYANSNKMLICNKSFSELIVRLKKGSRVLYWEFGSENLVKVITQKGVVGFCYRGYISDVKEVDKKKIARTTHGDVAIYRRNRAGKMVKKRTLKSGVPLIVVATKNDWVKVKNLYGTAFFMKKADLKKVW